MDTVKRPNRIPWPPIILAVTFVTGLALQWLAPFHLPAWMGLDRITMVLGYVLVLLALYIDFSCFRTMRHHNTTILPNKGADYLVTTGMYAKSRNPIYTGNVMIVAGAGLAFNNGWLLLLAPLMAVALYHLAIRREEAHLAAKFGGTWNDYAARTNRWL